MLDGVQLSRLVGGIGRSHDGPFHPLMRAPCAVFLKVK
jgi:hypothetical protein